MTPRGPDLTLREELVLAVPRGRVFAALTEGPALETWFPTRAETNPRAGGSFRFVWEGAAGEWIQEGVYLELDPPKRLVMTWSAIPKGSAVAAEARGRWPVATRVEVVLRTAGRGTRLTLEHAGWPADDPLVEEHREKHRSGWPFFLANLKSVLEEGRDARDPAMMPGAGPDRPAQ